jgi:GNAT superfamily N-acetyltransferase
MTTDFMASTDKSLLNVALIHEFLHDEARWCRGIPRDIVEKAIADSLCFGAFDEDSQVGFARVVTDYATYANLVDVFVISDYRGRGVSRLLMDAVIEHTELQRLRRFMLATSDKHALYEKFGFTALVRSEIFMEKFDPDVYA